LEEKAEEQATAEELIKGEEQAKGEEPTKGVEQAATPLHTTSWQKHLQAVRDGKRKVLRKETKKTYYYEVFLDDGSRTMFPCGEPL